MKKFVAVILLVVSLFVGVASAEVDFYPKAAVIVEINFDNFGRLFTVVEDGEGFLWEVYWDLDEETDISLGDVVALVMWDAETPEDCSDDEVLDAINEHFKAE